MLRYWVPVALWCGLIFFLSSIPGLDTGWGLWDLLLRKGAHMAEYAVLFLLLRRALGGTTALPPARQALLAVAGAVLYAASDEFHQSFVPGRGPSVVDVGIDALGVLGAWAVVTLKK